MAPSWSDWHSESQLRSQQLFSRQPKHQTEQQKRHCLTLDVTGTLSMIRCHQLL
jgi:hypothetical protein